MSGSHSSKPNAVATQIPSGVLAKSNTIPCPRRRAAPGGNPWGKATKPIKPNTSTSLSFTQASFFVFTARLREEFTLSLIHI